MPVTTTIHHCFLQHSKPLRPMTSISPVICMSSLSDRFPLEWGRIVLTSWSNIIRVGHKSRDVMGYDRNSLRCIEQILQSNHSEGSAVFLLRDFCIRISQLYTFSFSSPPHDVRDVIDRDGVERLSGIISRRFQDGKYFKKSMISSDNRFILQCELKTFYALDYERMQDFFGLWSTVQRMGRMTSVYLCECTFDGNQPKKWVLDLDGKPLDLFTIGLLSDKREYITAEEITVFEEECYRYAGEVLGALVEIGFIRSDCYFAACVRHRPLKTEGVEDVRYEKASMHITLCVVARHVDWVNALNTVLSRLPSVVLHFISEAKKPAESRVASFGRALTFPDVLKWRMRVVDDECILRNAMKGQNMSTLYSRKKIEEPRFELSSVFYYKAKEKMYIPVRLYEDGLPGPRYFTLTSWVCSMIMFSPLDVNASPLSEDVCSGPVVKKRRIEPSIPSSNPQIDWKEEQRQWRFFFPYCLLCFSLMWYDRSNVPGWLHDILWDSSLTRVNTTMPSLISACSRLSGPEVEVVWKCEIIKPNLCPLHLMLPIPVSKRHSNNNMKLAVVREIENSRVHIYVMCYGCNQKSEIRLALHQRNVFWPWVELERDYFESIKK